MAQLNRKHAERFIANIDKLSAYRGTVHTYAESITEELGELAEYRANDEEGYLQRCIIWALCTPMNNLDRSFRAMHRYLPHLYDTGQTVESIGTIISGDGDGWNGAYSGSATAILASLPTIYTLTGEGMKKETLRALKGVGALRGAGEKVMAMMIAPFNPDADVYTIDRHMVKIICDLIGEDRSAYDGCTDAAYVMIERAFIKWHRANFPTLPVFVSQWALWNGERKDVHASHLALIAD